MLYSKRLKCAAIIGIAAIGMSPTTALASPSSGITSDILVTADLDEVGHINSDRVKFQTKGATDVRVQRLTFAAGAYSGWHHHPGVIIVAVESKGKPEKLNEIGRQIALHIAAANPQAVSAEELDKALIDRERAVYLEQAKATGKEAKFIDKMVEGRLRKEFFGQVVLLQQTFMGPGGDGKMTVEQYLKGEEKAAGTPVKIAKFVRYQLGEGIDKKKDDFASEVAELTKGS